MCFVVWTWKWQSNAGTRRLITNTMVYSTKKILVHVNYPKWIPATVSRKAFLCPTKNEVRKKYVLWTRFTEQLLWTLLVVLVSMASVRPVYIFWAIRATTQSFYTSYFTFLYFILKIFFLWDTNIFFTWENISGCRTPSQSNGHVYVFLINWAYKLKNVGSRHITTIW